MYVMEERKIIKRTSRLFWTYIVVIFLSIIISVVNVFGGIGFKMPSTLVAIIIFIYSGSKSNIIENYLYNVKKTNYKKVPGLKFLLETISNLSLVIVIFSYIKEFFDSIYMSIFLGILIVILASILKWYFCFTEEVIGVKAMEMVSEKQIDKNDDILKTYVSRTERITFTDEFYNRLSTVADLECQGEVGPSLDDLIRNYSGKVSESSIYLIHEKVTKKNKRYYIIEFNEKLAPSNFLKEDYLAILKNNSELKIGIPMFTETPWPILEQASDNRLLKMAWIEWRKQFIKIWKSIFI